MLCHLGDTKNYHLRSPGDVTINWGMRNTFVKPPGNILGLFIIFMAPSSDTDCIYYRDSEKGGFDNKNRKRKLHKRVRWHSLKCPFSSPESPVRVASREWCSLPPGELTWHRPQDRVWQGAANCPRFSWVSHINIFIFFLQKRTTWLGLGKVKQFDCIDFSFSYLITFTKISLK